MATSAARDATDGSPSVSRGNGPAPSLLYAELSAQSFLAIQGLRNWLTVCMSSISKLKIHESVALASLHPSGFSPIP